MFLRGHLSQQARVPGERRSSGSRNNSFILDVGTKAPTRCPEQLRGEASHARLSKVGKLLGQREGDAALEERARGLPPLAQSGGLLLAQCLESQRTLEIQIISQTSILSILPKAVDPVLL